MSELAYRISNADISTYATSTAVISRPFALERATDNEYCDYGETNLYNLEKGVLFNDRVRTL